MKKKKYTTIEIENLNNMKIHLLLNGLLTQGESDKVTKRINKLIFNT